MNEPYSGKGTATAKFSAPGDYMLHVTANDYSGNGGGGEAVLLDDRAGEGHGHAVIAARASLPIRGSRSLANGGLFCFSLIRWFCAPAARAASSSGERRSRRQPAASLAQSTRHGRRFGFVDLI